MEAINVAAFRGDVSAGDRDRGGSAARRDGVAVGRLPLRGRAQRADDRAEFGGRADLLGVRGRISPRGSRRRTLALLRKYYVLTPLFVAAMLLVTVANSLGVMWAAIELTTLASVFLVTFYGKDTSLEAAWKYAIIGSVGLSMALFGTIVTYYAGHKLPGADGGGAELVGSRAASRAARQDEHADGIRAGAARVRDQGRARPDAHVEARRLQRSAVPTAAILSTAMLNCAVYGLIRFYVLTSRCLGPEYPGGLLLLLGIFSMGIAVPFVLVQKNLRRLLAYSTIDQAGIMAAALGIGGKVAALGLMLHMTFHSVAKPLLFFCAGNIGQRFKTDRLQNLKGGMIRVMPVTGAALFVGMLAIVGLPPLSLFQSEFLMAGAAFGAGTALSGALFISVRRGRCSRGWRCTSAGWCSDHRRTSARRCTRGARARWWRSRRCLVVIAFWLPGPLLELIRRAAAVVTGDGDERGIEGRRAKGGARR